jgi:hypothetical protein
MVGSDILGEFGMFRHRIHDWVVSELGGKGLGKVKLGF